MSVEPLGQVRDHFSDAVERVELEHERITVTRNGRPAAVLISPDDLAKLEETLEVLSDAEALADISEADAAYAAGDVLRGGVHSARRGTYRPLYRINEQDREVVVLRIEHRSDSYRPT